MIESKPVFKALSVSFNSHAPSFTGWPVICRATN